MRVTVDSSEGAPGSIVVTGIKGGAPQAAIVPWDGAAKTFSLPTTPGSGALLPLGAGYVYRAQHHHDQSAATADDSSPFRF